MSKIITLLNKNLFYQKLATYFIDCISKQENNFFIAVSGGNTAIGLYETIKKENLVSVINKKNIYIFWVDERCLPVEDRGSNYGNAYRSIFKNIDKANLFPMYQQKNIEDSIQLYSNTIAKYLPIDERKLPIFDLIILGMGDDGHTASLFPNSQGMQEKNKWVVKNYIEKLKTDRITLTFPVLNNAKKRIIAFKGKNKIELWKHILRNKPNIYPIEKIKKENTILFIGK